MKQVGAGRSKRTTMDTHLTTLPTTVSFEFPLTPLSFFLSRPWRPLLGYWVTDQRELNPRFGDEGDLLALSKALHSRNM